MKIIRLVLLIGAILLSGCAFYTINATEDNLLWGKYERNKEYVLERDLFLIRKGISTLYIIPEFSYKGRSVGRHRLAPESIEQYEKDPEKNSTLVIDSLHFKFNVVGIVRAGTKLKVKEIKKRKGWTFMTGGFEEIFPYARILTGSYEGTVVDIMDISIYYSDIDTKIFLYKPEPGVIRLVGNS